MASIVAFQAVDRGSIPRWGSFFDYFHYKNITKIKAVRSGIRTHAHIRGPECSHQQWGEGVILESGALDHSAILTCQNTI